MLPMINPKNRKRTTLMKKTSAIAVIAILGCLAFSLVAANGNKKEADFSNA